MTQPPDEIRNNFEAELRVHGYGFQAALTKYVGSLVNQLWASYRVSAVEFPVEVRGRSTKIDLVLSSPSGARQIVGECKRPNPALANWCFIANPFFGHDNAVRCEQLVKDGGVAVARSVEIGHVPAFAHFAFEVRTNTVGEATGRGRGAIEDAVGQVLTGVSGMAQLYRRDTQLLPSEAATTLVPAVFTTANLWLSNADLSATNLEDGNAVLASSSFQRVHWITLQYAQSLSLRHDLPLREQYRGLEQARRALFARSVPIVSPDGIDDFLQWCRAA
jgi:hypothetical protein